MNLENIKTERNLTQKATYCMTPFSEMFRIGQSIETKVG